ncbi:hypothetical protein F5879DRAFT_984196 [Lentinula edodes]|nr:hypothetical protein F5879DRAFT_984196 [Lentinula edodes]
MSDDGNDSFVENSSNEGSLDEADSSEVSLEDDISSPKSKKIQVKKKAAPSSSSATENDMDVDEDFQSSANGKLKAEGDGNRSAKKQRVDTDPWKLVSSKLYQYRALMSRANMRKHYLLSVLRGQTGAEWPLESWREIKNKIVQIEDPVQAGEYERRLQRRLSPFVTQLMLTDDGMGIVRIEINVPSVVHRALSRLPSEDRSEKSVLSWRLDTNFTPAAFLNLSKFTILNNKLDKEHAQPLSFKLNLGKEQTRGVLADEVGYGKTAIILGLIDCTWKMVEGEFAKQKSIDGKLSLKLRKFTGKRFKTLVLSTASNVNLATIDDFKDADIIIVASNIFKSNVCLDNLSSLAAVGPLPSKDGRRFNDHLRTVCIALRRQTNRFREEGSATVKAEIAEAQRRAEDEATQVSQLQSKRLKGKFYRNAADAVEKGKTIKQQEISSTKGEPKRTRTVLDSVEIPVYRAKSELASKSSDADISSDADHDEDEDASRKRRKRHQIPPRIAELANLSIDVLELW